MKTRTKYRLMSGLLASTLFISSWGNGTVKANASTIEQEQTFVSEEHSIQIEQFSENQTLQEYLNSIDNNQIKKFYTKLYELYDFETFQTKSIIPQYFQTIYGDKFSCGTIQSAGCGISSLAMVSSYLYDEIITPDMMKIYDNGPSPASAFEKAIKRLNLNCEVHRGQAAIDNLDAALEANRPVIALMGRTSLFTSRGHFIVIAEKTKDGKYIVNDPNIENYYYPHMIDGYTNGFTKEEVTRGLNGIYIFDAKENFIDQRDSILKVKSPRNNSQSNPDRTIDIVVTNVETTLKQSPLTESEDIITINTNIQLETISKIDEEWLLVKYNGKTGYVKKEDTTSLLDIVQTIYPELQLSEISPRKTVYITESSNIRCGNSVEFDAIGTLEIYETIKVLEEYGDWYFVCTNENTLGFIPKRNTKEIEGKCLVIDKSINQLYYFSDGKQIYNLSADNMRKIIEPKSGIYSLINKKMNLILFDSQSGWQNIFKNNNHTNTETDDIANDIYNNLQKEDRILVHK